MMTGTEAQNKLDVPQRQSPSSPRKRRRRAPTAGAANDCFTCQELKRKCDRRRPYCSQCLDHGKDCSGYKTTLTWNVGVASRGKLRGLSLPVAESKKVAQDSDAKPSKKRSSSDQTKESCANRSESQYPVTSQPFNPSSGTGTTKYNFINMDPSSNTASTVLPSLDIDWRSIPHIQGDYSHHAHKRLRRRSLKPLQVPALRSFRDLDECSMSAKVPSTYCDHEFRVSVECSPTASSYSGFDSCYEDFRVPSMVSSPFESSFFHGHDTVGWPRDHTRSSFSSDQSSGDHPEDDKFFSDPVVATSLDDLVSTRNNFNRDNFTPKYEKKSMEIHGNPNSINRPMELMPDDCGAHPPILPKSLSSLSVGKTPGLRFLIHYYDKVISPVIIAFDGPSNSYRSHILGLAIESETLQHAIAALSANNLRQRRAHHTTASHRRQPNVVNSSYSQSLRTSSVAHNIMNGTTNAGHDPLSGRALNKPSLEEIYHKTEAIKSLNEQLADPLRRTDDSVLATLLILCLYHICDTGIAKFKTQFADVRKLLALRRDTFGCNSKAVNWLTIMFTWFNAMTATANDREGQLIADHMSINESGEWTLENLAGCDNRLFKIIAKLGRLNLLSQNRLVRDEPYVVSDSQNEPFAVPPPKSQDYYSMNYNQYHGDGWSAIPGNTAATIEPGSRQFWREWNEIRTKLQEWQLDPPASSPECETMKRGRTDTCYISESFRYSALLYTERLAYPHLPSEHPCFQDLVTQALHYITNVGADVFMLWPLFITGAECVGEDGRLLIRERCLALQKGSGFFNNISCLEVLEKAWCDDDDGTDDFTNRFSTWFDDRFDLNIGGHGFKWRKAMETVDGDFIVV